MKTINQLLKAEQLQNLLKSSRFAILISLFLGLILIFSEWNLSNPKLIFAWFITLFLVSLIRIKLITVYQHNPSTNVETTDIRLRNIRISTFLSAILWGSIGILFFRSNDIDHLMFLIFILAGLTAGNTVSNASDLPSSIGFSILALFPIMINLFLNETPISFNMGLSLLLYFGFMVVIGRLINKNIIQSSILQHKAQTSEKEARISEERYRLILQHSPAGIVHYNKELIITFCNDRFAQVMQAPKEKLVGLDLKTLKDQRVIPFLKESIEGKEGLYEGEYISSLSNTKLWINMSYVPLHDPNGIISGGIAILDNITVQKEYQNRLKKSEETLLYLLKMAPIAVRIAKKKGKKVVFANEAYARLIKEDVSTVLGKNPKNYYSNQEEYEAVVTQINNDELIYDRLIELLIKNQTIWALASYMPIDFEGEACVLGWFYDVTEEIYLQKELEFIANYDALTGLPNRILESDRLLQGMAQAQRRKTRLAVIYLDLDGFKAVNDTYGHPVGDQLLIALSTRMKETLREGDTLARLGGDEFVAILVDLESASSAIPIIDRLLEAASLPIQLDDLMVQVSASIGVTFYPQENEVDGDQLIRQADQAMYAAKQSGKNRYQLFDVKQEMV